MTRPAASDLLIVVGLTGVGKSTVLDEVLRAHPSIRLLPNRRELTDRIVFPAVQRRLGVPERPVTDRLERFRLTAAYREMHPGGMAHALQAWLDRELRERSGGSATLVFDNLRGVHEVAAAAAAFPHARFLLLDAAPATRLARLVDRRDPFDRVDAPGTHREPGDPEAPAPPAAGEHLARLRQVPDADAVFDLERIAAWAARERIEPADVERATRIIVEEQRNYDNSAARRHLAARLPAERFLAVDTDDLTQTEVVRCVLAWLVRGA